MENKKPFYITTPIYYVNGEPHLGHAYTTIACDVMARFKRLDGYDVRFLTGTDEHGIKVMQAARTAGVEPQAFTDKVAATFKAILPTLNITNDDFIRTTEARHKTGAQALWSKLVASGAIYKNTYAGWYAVRDEAYYQEDETELKGDKRYAIASGAECTWMEEESYFFKLSEYGDKLLAYYAANPDFIQPEARKNEVMAFVKQGLKDLSISRTTFDWGIKVPSDDKHIMYVWIDALANYITALGYGQPNDALYNAYWKNNGGEIIHVVGKEIIRFHCVYWPAFLMAADVKIPTRVFAHGWWTVEGQKMSKSVGNVIAPDDMISRYGVDGARFALLRDVPFGNDGDFSHDQVVSRINADLANGLGNLAQRTLSQIAKNCEGKVPQPEAFTDDDKKLLDAAQNTMLKAVRTELAAFKFHKALDAIWDVVNAANLYVDVQAPWKLKKENPARMATVLYVLAEVIRCLGLIVQPFVPASSQKLLDQVAVPADNRGFSALNTQNTLLVGTQLPEPQGVFPRLETQKAA
ncbi:MAG: methionine--tRNA ligase [Proteobacteria bacterium]|nr:methionine--tRNA ligase [Pseudomonadota bacterium]